MRRWNGWLNISFWIERKLDSVKIHRRIIGITDSEPTPNHRISICHPIKYSIIRSCGGKNFWYPSAIELDLHVGNWVAIRGQPISKAGISRNIVPPNWYSIADVHGLTIPPGTRTLKLTVSFSPYLLVKIQSYVPRAFVGTVQIRESATCLVMVTDVPPTVAVPPVV